MPPVCPYVSMTDCPSPAGRLVAAHSPCVTAHAWWETLQAELAQPFHECPKNQAHTSHADPPRLADATSPAIYSQLCRPILPYPAWSCPYEPSQPHPTHYHASPPPRCRQFHLNTLVRVDGVVTRRTGVYPQLQRVMYDCQKCGAVLGPFVQQGDKEIKLGSCPSCESKGPFQVGLGAGGPSWRQTMQSWR